LGTRLRGVTRLWVTREVLGDAGVLLLVGRCLGDLGVADAHDLLQALVAARILEVLAALFLDLGAARVAG